MAHQFQVGLLGHLIPQTYPMLRGNSLREVRPPPQRCRASENLPQKGSGFHTAIANPVRNHRLQSSPYYSSPRIHKETPEENASGYSLDRLQPQSRVLTPAPASNRIAASSAALSHPIHTANLRQYYLSLICVF